MVRALGTALTLASFVLLLALSSLRAPLVRRRLLPTSVLPPPPASPPHEQQRKEHGDALQLRNRLDLSLELAFPQSDGGGGGHRRDDALRCAGWERDGGAAPLALASAALPWQEAGEASESRFLGCTEVDDNAAMAAGSWSVRVQLSASFDVPSATAQDSGNAVASVTVGSSSATSAALIQLLDARLEASLGTLGQMEEVATRAGIEAIGAEEVARAHALLSLSRLLAAARVHGARARWVIGSACLVEPCGGRGLCSEAADGRATCTCVAGWSGARCERPLQHALIEVELALRLPRRGSPAPAAASCAAWTPKLVELLGETALALSWEPPSPPSASASLAAPVFSSCEDGDGRNAPGAKISLAFEREFVWTAEDLRLREESDLSEGLGLGAAPPLALALALPETRSQSEIGALVRSVRSHLLTDFASLPPLVAALMRGGDGAGQTWELIERLSALQAEGAAVAHWRVTPRFVWCVCRAPPGAA